MPLRADNTKLLYNGQYKSTILIKQGKLIVIDNATNTMDILNNYFVICHYTRTRYTKHK